MNPWWVVRVVHGGRRQIEAAIAGPMVNDVWYGLRGAGVDDVVVVDEFMNEAMAAELGP